jgi:hypothetical protein
VFHDLWKAKKRKKTSSVARLSLTPGPTLRTMRPAHQGPETTAHPIPNRVRFHPDSPPFLARRRPARRLRRAVQPRRSTVARWRRSSTMMKKVSKRDEDGVEDGDGRRRCRKETKTV